MRNSKRVKHSLIAMTLGCLFSILPLANAAVIYNEVTDGDLRSSHPTLTVIGLNVGINSILATGRNSSISGTDFDSFSVQLLEGQELVGINFLVSDILLDDPTNNTNTILSAS